MSSVDVAVKAIKSLTSSARKALLTVESGMRRFEYVPLDLIRSALKVSPSKAGLLMGELVKDGFVTSVSSPYRGYSLTFAGADLLALKTLVERDVLLAVGKPVGVGKESEVYDALLDNEEVAAVKFHRIGRISFRQTRRLRSYATGAKVRWLMQARRAAAREYGALAKLHGHLVSVPKPISRTRHVVVMSALEGRPLIEYSGPISLELVKDVFYNIRNMYKAGVVHADLSEYNILVSEEGNVTIFDFPQWVAPNHRSADRYLSSDLKNLIRFFSKKSLPAPTYSSALGYTRGERKKLEWS